ncbi:MAG: thiamine phosphate synthase [Oscillospiraceae bacterium]|nr:thiamine phosphate synthase [Oscillospiraceae bacterium]
MRNNLLLYAISDGDLAKAQAALQGGVTLLQLRVKNLPDDELLLLARQVKHLTDKHNVPLIINDRVDFAVEVDAAGVHLGPSDGDLRAARAVLGSNKILGATARTLEQALAAQAAGANYLGSGAVFGSATKHDATRMPLELFREICGTVTIPVVAIGGIDGTNIHELRGCGMAGFAVAGGLFAAADVQHATLHLKEAALRCISPQSKMFC